MTAWFIKNKGNKDLEEVRIEIAYTGKKLEAEMKLSENKEKIKNIIEETKIL